MQKILYLENLEFVDKNHIINNILEDITILIIRYIGSVECKMTEVNNLPVMLEKILIIDYSKDLDDPVKYCETHFKTPFGCKIELYKNKYLKLKSGEYKMLCKCDKKIQCECELCLKNKIKKYCRLFSIDKLIKNTEYQLFSITGILGAEKFIKCDVLDYSVNIISMNNDIYLVRNEKL